MIDITKLPEKSHFNLEELAERWECDLTMVWYYIDKRMLRLAINMEGRSGLCGIYLSEIEPSKKSADSKLSIWEQEARIGADVTEDIDEQDVIRELPNYLYITCASFLAPINNLLVEQALVFENFSGEKIAILKEESTTVEGEPINKFLQTAISVQETEVISKEERDRFELEHGMIHTQEPSKVSEKELLTPFNLPPKLPNDAARVMCEQGNVLANKLGRTPTQSELRSFILKDNAPYIYVGELDTGDIDIGDCRVSKRGFADRYRKYLTPQKT